MQKFNLILHPNMDKPISYYFEDESRLDEISVTELESFISLAPFNQAIQMLLAKKLSSTSSVVHNASFINNDRSNLSVFLNHKNIYELNQESLVASGPKASESETSTVQPESGLNEGKVILTQSDEYSIIGSESEASVDLTVVNPELHKELSPSEHEKNDKDIIEDQTKVEERHENSSEENVTLISASDINDKVFDENSHVKKDKKHKKRKKKKSKDKTKKFEISDYSGTSDYVQWLLTISGKQTTLIEEKRAKKKKKVSESAKKSITKSAQIISEPLADILAAQGHFNEAIKMYDQLILKFPEKSSYFAAKIDNLLKIKE